MNKSLRSGLAAIFFSFVFLAVSVVDVSAQGILGQILGRMDNYNKSLQSLRADVTMVKYDSVLNITDKPSFGTTSYLSKTANSKGIMYVRVDWTRPVEEQMSVIGDDYELYRPRLNQVISGKVQKARNNASFGGALSFMNMSKAQLNANYTAVYIADEQLSDGTKAIHIQLTPKAKTSYKGADLWVDADGMPRQAKITEQNNDWTTVLLTNPRKNDTLKAAIFKLTYPSTAKKIKA